MKNYRKYSEQINVRVPHSVKKEMKREAKNKGVSLSEIVNRRLVK
ncbi:MAG: toxin-antitoxin system HicB family antitoxin [Flavobacteriaceae bacterium]|nr:toxin-antitoxin system HicB family antitoxin [Flavobacteriaceae bacterium]